MVKNLCQTKTTNLPDMLQCSVSRTLQIDHGKIRNGFGRRGADDELKPVGSRRSHQSLAWNKSDNRIKRQLLCLIVYLLPRTNNVQYSTSRAATCKAVAAFSDPTALLMEISLKTDVKSVDSRAKNNGTVVSSPECKGKC